MISNPFRGTRSFTEAADDWPLFGQRDAEVAHLVACLRNFNVTVLFGDNRVGKTSLLRAGLLSHLLHEAQENTKTLGAPIIGVALLPSSADDSPDLAGPHEAILSALNEFVRSASFVITSPDGSLAFHETLVYLSQGLGGFRRRGAIFIILDAFEEYLQHTPSNRSVGEFLLALSHIVYAMDINVNLLLSVRSSAFSELSKIRHFFPDIFDHAVELLSFNSQQAASVIRSTIDVYNNARANEEPVAYCEDIAVSYVTSGLTSASTARRSATRSRQSNATQDDITSSTIETSTFIEPVCLQIVMSHLWEVSLTQWDKQGRVGNINIVGSTLKQLGGVERIFYRYLDARVQALPERTKDIVVALFPYLVAPASATGIAHHIDDLFEYFNLATHRYGDACSKDDVAGAIRLISRGQNRILRELPGERFEVFASPLRLPIIEWVQRHKELERLLALTLHAKQQFAQSQIGAITEVLKCARQVKEGIQRRVGIEGHPAVFTIITTLREMLVNIREKPLYAAGMGTPTAGPVRSVAIVGQVPLVLAGHADGSIVIRKLQKGRGAERIPEIEQVNEGSLLAIDCWGREPNLVAAGFWSGRATICNVLTRQRFVFNHDSPVWAVRISPDGHMLATGSGDGMVRIWPIGKGRPWTSAAHANVVHFVGFSADSAYLLSVSWDGRVRLTNTSSHLSVVSALEEALFYTGTVCSNAKMLVAAGTWGGRVYLFDERMCCIRRFRAHKAIIAGIKFLRTESDNPYLLTVSWDGTARE